MQCKYCKIDLACEEHEQEALVGWLELKGYKFTAIPNSTFTRSWKQKAKNHRTGLRPGFPDLAVIKNSRLYLIELKRRRGGTVSKEQKEWIKALQLCEGVTAVVCKGSQEAIDFLNKTP